MRFQLHPEENRIASECIAGLIMRGLRHPSDCPYFGKARHPTHPSGALMVSSEGICAAYYRYKQRDTDIYLGYPILFTGSDHALLVHGGKGRMTHQLISQVLYPVFRNPLLEQGHDGCAFLAEGGRLAYSTSSFVVDPIFFPGGDISDLAINGTVNDLACCGARPLYLTAGFILEEGLPLADLQRIVQSTKHVAERAGVQTVAGDTKVVERGEYDKLFIDTSRIGIVPPDIRIASDQATPGGVVTCNGPIGLHGVTILSAQESLGFKTNLKSNTASLNIMISELLYTIREVHVLRDPTRGGISGILSEIAQNAGVDILLDENTLSIPEAVHTASGMLGLDPPYIVSEGSILVILSGSRAERALSFMGGFEEDRQVTTIGRTAEQNGE